LVLTPVAKTECENFVSILLSGFSQNEYFYEYGPSVAGKGSKSDSNVLQNVSDLLTDYTIQLPGR
jgi:hypothetical protein